MQDEVVVVVASGARLSAAGASLVPLDARVVAADGGVAAAHALGLHVDTVVGDLDSASPLDLERAEAGGALLDRHPVEKDATDLELALEAAAAASPRRIVVLADDGGRLDHLLSALLVLGAERYAEFEIDAQVGRALVHVVRRERVLAGRMREVVSLLALHGPARGVRTDGLAYPLTDETLEPGSSRGVSNVFVAETATVSVARGVLLAIRPDPETDEEGST